MMEGSGSGQIMMDPDPGGPKTYGSESATLLTNIRFCFSQFIILKLKLTGRITIRDKVRNVNIVLLLCHG